MQKAVEDKTFAYLLDGFLTLGIYFSISKTALQFAPSAEHFPVVRKIGSAGGMDRCNAAHARFEAFTLFEQRFLRRYVADLAEIYLAVAERYRSDHLKLHRDGALRQCRNVQHVPGRTSGEDTRFVCRISIVAAAIICERQQVLGDEIGGKHAGFADSVLGQLIKSDAGHYADFTAPAAVADPAEQPEIRRSVLLIRAVEEQGLGTKIVADGSGNLCHCSLPPLCVSVHIQIDPISAVGNAADHVGACVVNG